MTKPFEHWTVLPHGKLVQTDQNSLTVVGEIHLPLMDLPRRMTVVRLADRFSRIVAPKSRSLHPRARGPGPRKWHRSTWLATSGTRPTLAVGCCTWRVLPAKKRRVPQW